jgi:predicted nucleic acid-binding protein
MVTNKKKTAKEVQNRYSSLFFFYDSYAVIEYLNGNENYREYFDNADGILTKLNLMEVYFRILRVRGHRAAKEVLDSFSRYLTDFDLLTIEGAMKLRLRLKNKKRVDISYADALGYHIATKQKIKFLTGDTAFKDLENVEFVR